MLGIKGTSTSVALGWLLKAAGVAAVYFAVGRLTLYLAVPPSYSAALWPPAGIALAGVLLLGYRVWPGVFLASFLIVSTTYQPAAPGTMLAVVALPAFIAAGATLQAILGAFLVRRFVGFPSNFDRLGRIVGTMALGGPVACVISATVAIACLFQADAIPPTGWAQIWVTWFLGDTIGVLVVIPLASAWAAELHRASRRALAFVSLPVLAALVITVLGYLNARAEDLGRAQEEFERRADIMARTLEQTVLAELEIVQSVVSLFEASDEVSRAEFRAFVEPTFARRRDSRGLGWVALVSNEERAAVEEAVRQNEMPQFRITERSAAGEIVAAAERDEYSVVFYIEPYEGNEEALGFDLASEPDRKRVLDEARDSGEPVATPPISLVQEPSENKGFLIVAPIYEKGLPRDTLDERRRNLHSFVSVVFSGNQIVEEALNAFQGEGIDVTVVDTSEPADARELYGERNPTVEAAGASAGLVWSKDLAIAGRVWTARFRPAPSYASLVPESRVWVVLTGGLFFTNLLGAFLLVVAGRASATERVNEQLRREITERIRAEALLSSSEERFRAVFENAAVGVALVGTDGRLNGSNAALQEMLGYGSEELAEMRFADFTHPEDLDANLGLFKDLLAGNRQHYEMEKRYITRSGETIWGHLAVGFARDPDGQPLFGVAVVQDITDGKVAEEALRKNQVQLLEAQRIAQFGSWEWNIRGDVMSVSDEAYRIMGVEPQRFSPTMAGFLERVHPKDSERVRRSVEDAIAGREADGLSFRIVRPDGSLRICRAQAEVQRDEDGSAIRIRGSFRDITEKKERDDALRYTQFTVDRAVDGISWIEQDGRFSYVNDAACKMTGYSREELLEMTVSDLDHILSPEAWPILWKRIQRSGSMLIESTIVRRDGTSFPSELAIGYLEVGGVGRCLASGRDITERRNAEEETRRLEAKVQETQKLESLGVLAGGIAHDFNNLLVGVLSNADLALAELPPDDPERRSLLDIQTSAQRAADLASQLLAYSGRGKFVVEPINLSELVVETSDLAGVSTSKIVAIEYDLAEDLPVLEADPTQLRQVVLNLIINASEAIGAKPGVISVRTGTMLCDASNLVDSVTAEDPVEGNYVFVEVTDDGSGMDEETRKKIFDPFFSTKFTGRGLGLAAVIGIVRGHKGAIEVQSEPGSGTRIRVLFPASERVAPQPVAEKADADWKGEGTVLLVDDEEMVRNVGRRMLTRLGFSVLTAVDGVEALEIYREQADDIALVVLDLAMPRMGGKEALAEIRQVRDDVTVLLSSGYNEEETASQFEASEVAGFIHKPYRLADLRASLSKALDGAS